MSDRALKCCDRMCEHDLARLRRLNAEVAALRDDAARLAAVLTHIGQYVSHPAINRRDLERALKFHQQLVKTL